MSLLSLEPILTLLTVDRVLDSCFQLLSLCFMTIGQNNSAPAAYALTATIKRLLDHLTEVDLFSAKDLESISETLNQLSRNIKHSSEYSSPYLITLLMNRLDLCKRSLASLQKRLSRLEDPLPNVHEKLISILRSISLANTRTKVLLLIALYCLECYLHVCSSVFGIRSQKPASAAEGD